MPAVKGRSQRSGPRGVPTVLLQGQVSREASAAAESAADEAGISLVSYLQELIAADTERPFTKPMPSRVRDRCMQGRVPVEIREAAQAAISRDEFTGVGEYLDTLVRADARQRRVRPKRVYRQEEAMTA